MNIITTRNNLDDFEKEDFDVYNYLQKVASIYYSNIFHPEKREYEFINGLGSWDKYQKFLFEGGAGL